MAATLVKKANPNLHGVIVLWEENGAFYVTTPDDEDGTDFDGDKEAAEAYFEAVVKRYSETPNMEAQAEYDAVWGEPLQPWWNEQ